MKRKNHVWVLILSMICWGAWATGLDAQAKPDISVTDIVVQRDGFIYIKLENRSNMEIAVNTALKEKIFLTIYINNLKRAEYKLKYMKAALFKKRGRFLFRTNFRLQQPLQLKVEVNRLKIFPESNYKNNRMQKKMVPGAG